MFDIGITELGVIAVVALIVIGPERLPRVARMIGTLLGRAQRYVNDVKAEVNREIELDELKKLQTQIQDAAQSVQQQMSSVGSEVQTAVHDAGKSFQTGIDAVGGEMSSAVKSIEQSAGSDIGSGGSEPSPAGPAGATLALASVAPEPSPAGPAVGAGPAAEASIPYMPLEEPPPRSDDPAALVHKPSPRPPAMPVRDPRAAVNFAAGKGVAPELAAVARTDPTAIAAADPTAIAAPVSPAAPAAVPPSRLRDPRASTNTASPTAGAEHAEAPAQSSLFR